ncbi:MAG: hypothetical protein CVU50_05730 [Candidatus Cloacimonetes bacterium HGW-Cloacimonetes-3]|nr:MAG: hypothetical protein CVU50_05730 [Candidatus Cloacimonetes bacterium HGW-Cloacimonetes-3]
MKTTLVLVFSILAVLLCAQEMNPFGTLRHSSVDSAGNLHLRWEDISQAVGVTECFYKTGTGVWSSAVVNMLEPGTLEALIPYTFGQRLRYRLRFTTTTDEGEISMMHAAYFDADAFPLNLSNMAHIITDPEGDFVVGNNPNLDIRETYVGATTDKLYFTLKNVSGQYPTMNSFTSFNAYMCNIINAESVLTDSITYAMVYANIPILLSNGLYKVGYDAVNQLPVFTRLGNIQAQISGGALHLACNYSDLAADPDFGGWPNAYYGLVLSASTLSATISPTLAIETGDYSNPAAVLFLDNVYDVAVNHPPLVDWMNYLPETGTLYLTYFDEDGDFPLIAEVQNSNGTVVQAQMVDPLNIHSTWFAQLPVGTQGTLTWNFSDNGYTMVTGQYNPSAAEDDVLLPAAISCQMPNPYKANHAITLKGLGHSLLKVSVFNVRGQKVEDVYSGIPNSAEYNVSINGNLASGIYFLRIEQGSRSYNHKFVFTK